MYRKKSFQWLIVFLLIIGTLITATNVTAATPEEIIQECTKTIERNPNDAPSYMDRGLAYSELRKYKLAIKDFDKAIKLIPSNVPNYLSEAYYNRGLNYYLLGMSISDLNTFSYAIQDYNKAIELNPNYAEAYNKRGLAAFVFCNPRLLKPKLFTQSLEKIMEDFNKAIELNPNYAEVYFNIGTLYSVILNKYGQAIQNYNIAIELDPNYVRAYNDRGVAYYELEQYNIAIGDATTAIQIDPNYATAYQLRGECYKKLGDKEKAKVDFDKAKELQKKR